MAIDIAYRKWSGHRTSPLPATNLEAFRAGWDAAKHQQDNYSKDFQLMLVRIIQRHRNGRDLTQTLDGALDLIKRKGSLSPFRADEGSH